MTKTLSGLYANGYVLAAAQSATLNPLTITGTILPGTNPNHAALYGNPGAAWTVANQGSIAGGNGAGIDLLGGGLVTNASGATITGDNAVYIYGGAGTVHNAGTITSATQTGVFLISGGIVTNDAGAHISGAWAIAIDRAPGTAGLDGTVVNDGTLTGGSEDGVYLQGGTVTNDTNGLITGAWGVVSKQAATIDNAGTITATAQSAIYLTAGTVTNLAGGTIAGPIGVDLRASSTLDTAGTIIGNAGTAASFAAGYANLLRLAPGAAFSGLVEGGNTIGATATSTIELTPGIGTLTGIGTTIRDFANITIDPAAAWRLEGDATGFAGTISGFSADDTIELAGLTGSLISFTSGTLSLQSSAGPLALHFSGDFTGQTFALANSAGGIDISLAPPCFRAGPHIATDYGPVAVEHLQAGDRLRLARSDATAEITWLGHRHVNCRRHPDPRAVWPVRILAGAFAPGRPMRDLFLSPDHAVHVNDVLIPIRHLVNGATIAQIETDTVTYWHVELATHDVILAENLPCESYLDTGNRSAFANGGPSIALHPDFALRIWDTTACAPLVRDGAPLATTSAPLLARAEHLGYHLTRDPMLHILAGPRRIFPTTTGPHHHFRLPLNTRHITLKSRSIIPQHLGQTDDPRRLGIAIATLHGNGFPIPLTDPRLGQGWHPPEHGGATHTWRWTNGTATLDATGLTDLTLTIAYTEQYWREPDPMSRRRA